MRNIIYKVDIIIMNNYRELKIQFPKVITLYNEIQYRLLFAWVLWGSVSLGDLCNRLWWVISTAPITVKTCMKTQGRFWQTRHSFDSCGDAHTSQPVGCLFSQEVSDLSMKHWPVFIQPWSEVWKVSTQTLSRPRGPVVVAGKQTKVLSLSFNLIWRRSWHLITGGCFDHLPC